MANPEHLAKLNEGVEAWNRWRKENLDIRLDISGANLIEANLSSAYLNGADLSGADLSRAQLDGADLRKADLSKADLSEAKLVQANLSLAVLSQANLFMAALSRADLRGTDFNWAKLDSAHLTEADLRGAYLIGGSLSGADLRQANLSGAVLRNANFFMADLRRANLIGADLTKADLDKAFFTEADLSGADLTNASLIGTIFRQANLTGCRVYGVSAWDLKLEGAIQSNLIITKEDQAAIQVDNLEVAQFIYLLLNNQRIRQVIDTITSKVVLILGRFTPERKAVLDAIRNELRKHDYLPVLFDFDKPSSKDLTGTVKTLANMARFIIADLTEPSSIPYELGRIVPDTKVAVQAIIRDGQAEFAMFRDLLDYRWVLPPYRYQSQDTLLANLDQHVIAPAEAKVKELRDGRNSDS